MKFLSLLISMLLLAVFNSVGEAAAGGGVERWSGCKVPTNVLNLNWDPKNEEPGGFYFPITSKSERLIDEQMLGREAAQCVRMSWSDSQVVNNTFYGVNGKTFKAAGFDCVQVRPPKDEWDCVPTKSKGAGQLDYDLTHTGWVTMTDDNSYSFVVRCFHKAKVQGWVLLTTSKTTLTPELKLKTLEHAKQLGYATARDGMDYMTRSYGPPCQELSSNRG